MSAADNGDNGDTNNDNDNNNNDNDNDNHNSSSGGTGGDDDNADNSQPPSDGEEKKADSDDNSESSSKVVTAQEARVRRMRARFLDMKSLIDEEPAGPSSPTATSPRNELGYGLDALKLEEDDIASAAPVKGVFQFGLVTQKTVLEGRTLCLL